MRGGVVGRVKSLFVLPMDLLCPKNWELFLLPIQLKGYLPAGADLSHRFFELFVILDLFFQNSYVSLPSCSQLLATTLPLLVILRLANGVDTPPKFVQRFEICSCFGVLRHSGTSHPQVRVSVWNFKFVSRKRGKQRFYTFMNFSRAFDSAK